MLLALDVGNTNVTVGAFSGRRLAAEWRYETAEAARPGFGRRLAADARSRAVCPSAAVFGSVVPRADAALARALRSAFGLAPLQARPTRLGIKLRVKRPEEVGADRVLNALAASDRHPGRPAVVVDFGTATTFDCVSARGDYVGGAILPGPLMAARALAQGTAQLPLVPIARPRRAIGRDTVECIQGGIYFGYLGMIEKVLRLTLAELGGRARVLATGGLSRLFIRDLPRGVEYAPGLTLEGLRLAYERLTTR